MDNYGSLLDVAVVVAGVIHGIVEARLRDILSYFDAFRSISDPVIIVCLPIVLYF